MSGTLVDMELPETLRLIAPTVGSVWCWEPLKDHAREMVAVSAVTWNGEECWVESVTESDGKRCWNDLGRWVEATVLVTPADE
jgi:hypothetical protein